MAYVLVCLMGYCLGCSHMAVYLAKWKKIDLKNLGSGNNGASNAAIVLGWRAGILTALHDMGKAALAVAAAGWLFPQLAYAREAAGAACVVGHVFPVFLKFRGGKGFAPYLGMTLVLNWKLALILMLAVAVITLAADYIVFGTFVTVCAVPIYQGIAHENLLAALILAAASAVVIWKHRENIVKILSGTEIGLRSTLRKTHRIEKEKA